MPPLVAAEATPATAAATGGGGPSAAATAAAACALIDVVSAPVDNLPPQQYVQYHPSNFKKPWTISKSSSLYHVEGWGLPYFYINSEGHMGVRPSGASTLPGNEIDIIKALQKVIESRVLGNLGIPTPLIMRFPDVLKHRLERLQSSFDQSILNHGYQGRFKGVFPVKCNQDRFVVEKIVEFGKNHAFGLEAGSKPELLLAMASLCKGNQDALLICNGYKDADYVCLALMARKLQFNCVIVLEQEQELDLVLKMSWHLGIDPILGLRAKLNTKHAGHFGETSGENGKFGLTCLQIVGIVQKLRRANKLHCLQLLHFHIGSQIPSLGVVNDGVSEAAHIYCELSLMGANMQIFDIGGGLGIDYDGSHSAESEMSVGYTLDGYANEVVLAVKNACAMKGVKEPTLCSESGRALVSHHSVLIFDVLSAHEKGGKVPTVEGLSLENIDEILPEDLGILYRRLIDFAQIGCHKNCLELAAQLKLSCIEHFKHGRVSLTQLAAINSLYEATECTSNCNSTYHINLSIFKSMPDSWAIGQLFPIVPLHRLEEEPTVRAILSDLTCDSDGKITKFVGNDAKGNQNSHLRLHSLEDGKPYYMGMFLGGAYQEALGSMHNLFGTPPVVNVALDGGTVPSLTVVKTSDGQKASDMLSSMHYDASSMLDCLKVRVEDCMKEGKFNDDKEEQSAMAVIHTLANSFASGTYLSTNHFSSSVVSNVFQP